MTRQTKIVKSAIILLFFIPIILLAIGVIQTFVINSKQRTLQNLQQEYAECEQQKQELDKSLEYIEGDYIEDYYNHKHGYGKEGDVIIDVQTK